MGETFCARGRLAAIIDIDYSHCYYSTIRMESIAYVNECPAPGRGNRSIEDICRKVTLPSPPPPSKLK